MPFEGTGPFPSDWSLLTLLVVPFQIVENPTTGGNLSADSVLWRHEQVGRISRQCCRVPEDGPADAEFDRQTDVAANGRGLAADGPATKAIRVRQVRRPREGARHRTRAVRGRTLGPPN